MTEILLLGLAAAVAVSALIVFRRSPRTAFAVWTALLCFAPYWAGVDLGGFLTATSVVGALGVAALHSSRRPGVGAVDLMLVIVVVIYGLGLLVADATIATGFVLVAHWSVGYLFGRTIASTAGLGFVYDVVALAFTVAAVLAVAEFLSGVNLFHRIVLDNSAHSAWSGQQFRGGLPRAEGAFGHSIALGCSLALSIPLTICCRFREWIRAGMVVVVLAGTVATFSRTAMICAALSLVLAVLFLRGGIALRTRIALLAGAAVVTAVVGPLVLATFVEAGSEATGSSAYRGDLLALVPSMRPIGLSTVAYRSPSGEFYFGGFQSIDSALILLGLTHGYISLGIVTVLLVVAGWFVVSGRATPPTVAVVAQIPALLTVALITQYGIFLWVMAGLAVASQLLASGRAVEARTPGRPASPDGARHAGPAQGVAAGRPADGSPARRSAAGAPRRYYRRGGTVDAAGREAGRTIRRRRDQSHAGAGARTDQCTTMDPPTVQNAKGSRPWGNGTTWRSSAAAGSSSS